MTTYTLKEIADSLKVSVKTITKAIKQRQLAAMKIGKSWRVSEDAFNDYLESRTIKIKKRA